METKHEFGSRVQFETSAQRDAAIRLLQTVGLKWAWGPESNYNDVDLPEAEKWKSLYIRQDDEIHGGSPGGGTTDVIGWVHDMYIHLADRANDIRIGAYRSEFMDDGSVKFGCTTATYEQIKEVVEASPSAPAKDGYTFSGTNTQCLAIHAVAKANGWPVIGVGPDHAAWKQIKGYVVDRFGLCSVFDPGVGDTSFDELIAVLSRDNKVNEWRIMDQKVERTKDGAVIGGYKISNETLRKIFDIATKKRNKQ